jgi:predicted GNAT family N-acyltransferase
VELVELGTLTEQDWADLVDGEPEPFGSGGAELQWRPKTHHVGLRASEGQLVAAAGALVAGVAVERAGTFEVVGVGSVIVTRALRGRGLFWRVIDPLMQLATRLGPDRAMLFCRPALVELYGRLGFREIADPVWVHQPRGRIEMPMAAMWRPLREGGAWPPGRVDVDGLPF